MPVGSKSPLSYQDSFEITTISNGIKYSYIFAQATPVPTATLLLEEETDEPNGTSIRVEINEEDDWKALTETRKQLVYFNNVYVKHEEFYYNNNFKIYEAKDYRIRNQDHPFGNEMHITVGQVAYPINWKVLDIPIVHIPVAVKFGVGDIEVTLSREEVYYTEKVKAAIKDKVGKVTKVILEKYEKQLKITDLDEYYLLSKDKHRPPLKIEDITIPMDGVKTNITFEPFEGCTIKASKILDLFSGYSTTLLKKGKNFEAGSTSGYYNDRIFKKPYDCYLVEDKYSYYDSKYIEDGILFKRTKLNKKRYMLIADILGRVTYNEKDSRVAIVQTGTAALVNKVLKYIDKYLKTKIEPYNGVAPSHWIENLKQEALDKKERTKGEITYYNYENKRTKVKFTELIENNKYIFYISKSDDKEKILAYEYLFSKGHRNFKKQAIFIVVSASVIPKFKKIDNIYPVESILHIKSFKRLLCSLSITKKVMELQKTKECYGVSKYYTTLWKQLFLKYQNTFEQSYYRIPMEGGCKKDFSINLCTFFEREILAIKESIGNTFLYEESIPILKEAAKKLYLVEYTRIDYMTDEHRIQFIKSLKCLKIDAKYYY